jgi:hypothetical protein
MKLIKKILAFFGFGGQMDKTNSFERLLEEFSSISRQNEAKQSAYQAIQKGDDISPDKAHPYEATIRADAMMVDTACTQYHTDLLKKSFGDAQYLSVLLQAGLQNELSQATPSEIESKIRSRIAQHEAEANIILEENKKAQHDLEVFKGANGLSSSATYPDKKNSLYIIAGIGILEAIFNAWFLRMGLGGPTALLIAISVAALNIAGSVWLGGRYREKNHIKPERAATGRLNKIYAILLILMLNGMIAGYRLWYMSSSEGITGQFILESTILFIVGIAMGIIAFNKGYELDDPYPDYGAYSRRLAEWQGKLLQMRADHALYCAEEKKQADRKLDELERKIITASDNFSLQLPEMSKLLKVWDADRSKINFAYKQIVEIFKLIINGYHPNSNKGYPSEINDLTENIQLKSFREQVNHFSKSKEDLKGEVSNLRNDLRTQKELLQTWWQSDSSKELLSFPK